MDRGIAILTYNRANNLGKVIEGVINTKPSDTQVVICDDGSTDDTPYVCSQFRGVTYIRGQNLGVGANKNRALFVLQDCNFICLLEDDLLPVANNWFEDYENACLYTGIHHICRVQDKFVEENVPEFTEHMKTKGLTPVYGPSVRGDLTFITKRVIKKVGGFHPTFIGVGYAHGEWSNRVYKANLIPHPNKWIDFEEVSKKFVQIGDTEGGRWLRPKRDVKEELKRNGAIAKKLRATNYLFHPLVFP